MLVNRFVKEAKMKKSIFIGVLATLIGIYVGYAVYSCKYVDNILREFDAEDDCWI